LRGIEERTSQTRRRMKIVVYIVAGLLVLFGFKAHPMVGVAVLILIGVIWANRSKKTEALKVKNELLAKCGPETMEKIKQKRVELGMSREVVDLAWGPAANEKTHVDAKGTNINCDYHPIERNGSMKYRHYAQFKDGVLASFGEY